MAAGWPSLTGFLLHSQSSSELALSAQYQDRLAVSGALLIGPVVEEQPLRTTAKSAAAPKSLNKGIHRIFYIILGIALGVLSAYFG